MSSVQSAVGMVIGLGVDAAETYDVRSITKSRVADNQAYVSSKTGGKTFRVDGNLDATWEISLFALSGMEHIPSELQPGQRIKVKCPVADGVTEEMLVDSATLEVDVGAAAVIGISLSCSAVDGSSYVDNP